MIKTLTVDTDTDTDADSSESESEFRVRVNKKTVEKFTVFLLYLRIEKLQTKIL